MKKEERSRERNTLWNLWGEILNKFSSGFYEIKLRMVLENIIVFITNPAGLKDFSNE